MCLRTFAVIGFLRVHLHFSISVFGRRHYDKPPSYTRRRETYTDKLNAHSRPFGFSRRMVYKETRWQEPNQDTLQLRERIPGEALHTGSRFQ